MAAKKRFRTAVVGATGVAGQQFLVALAKHPWFDLVAVAAGERSAGKSYREAVTDPATGALRWFCDEEFPRKFGRLHVQLGKELKLDDVDLVFSAVESDAAKELEPLYAERLPVFSTAGAFRREPDVPILMPGINPKHVALLKTQKKKRKWRGFIAPGPNCTTVGLAFALAPLHEKFGLRSVMMTSMQAISGAGRTPGVLGYDILDNVLPFIPNEEEKVAKETCKILGTFTKGSIRPAPITVSAACTRVNVLDAHLETVAASLKKKATVEQVKEVWRKSYKDFLKLKLPSAPPELLYVHEDPFRPQPRLDRNRHGGMTTVIGRVRSDEVLANGIKYVLLSHNTKMGAAMGAILTAEYLVRLGVVK